MNDELAFEDTMRVALDKLAGVGQALGHVTDRSTDYEMCQMLSDVVMQEVNDISAACPEEWQMGHHTF